MLPKPREDSGKQLPRRAIVTNTSQPAIKKPKVDAPVAEVQRAPVAKLRPRIPALTRTPSPAITATRTPTSAAALSNPRQALLTSLTDAIRDATSAGDMGAARIAMDALTKLMGDAGTASGSVVDLSDKLRKRRR